MKNYKYILPFLFASLFISCETDYLDVVPDNLATIDNAFANRFNTFKYLTTCYSYMPDASSTTTTIGLNVGDEIQLPANRSNDNGVLVTNGFLTASAPRYDFWNGTLGGTPLYEGIRHCNVFLANVDAALDLDEDEKNLWISEVKFLKAYYHFYLLRMYGPIVLNKELIDVNEDYNNYDQVGRQPIDDCFLYVVELLDEAIVGLPPRIDNVADELGRITKPIAAAIKARVLMNYASPLYNGNTVFSELKGPDGEELFPSAYDPERWQLAATACKEAIDLSVAAGNALYQKEAFTSPYILNLAEETKLNSALRQRVTENWNNEIIWGYTGNSSNNLQRDCHPILEIYDRSPVGNNHGPTIRIAETYHSKNGVPINEDVTFDYENRYKTRTIEEADNGYYLKVGEETALLNIDREPRFYADLGFDRGTWWGNGRYEDDENPWVLRTRYKEANAFTFPGGSMVTGYLAKKLLNLDTTISTPADSAPTYTRYAFPIIRLADLYLYYAEALNEVKGSPDGEVYEYIDLVRERAELDGVVSSWNNYSRFPSKPTTKEGMREIIQQERLIELSLEGRRYWDLRRWKLLKDKMNTPIRGWNFLAEGLDDYYTLQTLVTPTFSEKDYFWPIRESELQNNPLLIQNIGW